MATADASAAVAALAAAAAAAPSFKPVVATLEAHAAAQPQLVGTLAAQLRTAIAALPGKAGAAAASAPAAAVNLSAAVCTLAGVSCLAPRGRYDIVLTADTLALVAKGVPALAVPLAAIEHLLLLEKPAEVNTGAKAAAARTIYFMLALASGAHAEFGKQKLGVLLLSVKTSETLSGTHPLTKAPLAGSAPDVLAQALSAATGKEVEQSSAAAYRSTRGAAAIAAHVKVNPGLLFPLRSGFAFVERPPLFLAASAWDGVALGRVAGTNQTFDLVVSGVEFGMISRDEMPGLQEYVAGRTRALAKRAAKAEAGVASGAGAGADGAASGDAGAAAPAAPAAAPAAAASEDGSSDEEDEDFAVSDGAGDSGGSGSASGSEESGGESGSGGGGGKAPKAKRGAAAGAGSESDSDDGAAWGVRAAEPTPKKARAE